MSTASLDIVVGESWKLDARCLARLHAYGGDGEQFDFRPILDIIDIVVDGANITSRLPEESIFCFMFELVHGLTSLFAGRVDKYIVAFQEAPWELAIQRRGDEFEISFYRVERPFGVLVHNAGVDARRLRNAVCLATESLLADLVIVNPAFAEEGLVCTLKRQLGRLRGAPLKRAPTPAAPVASRQRPGAVRVGPKRLAFEVAIDSTHPDLLRYQGAADTDLHSLLFSGRLTIVYRGRRRQAVDSGYLFPVLEGLVGGAARLVGLLERGRGTCTVLDRDDGADLCLSADLTGSQQIRLRMVEADGRRGQTQTTPDELFTLLLETAQAVIEQICEINPHQRLNRRVDQLRLEIDALRARFVDVLRGDLYFDDVQGYLRSAPPVYGDPPERHVGHMPWPPRELRHLFLRSTWNLARDHIDFHRVNAIGDSLLVPSTGRIDCLHRGTGEVIWDVAADRLLTSTRDVTVSSRGDEVAARRVATGEVLWEATLGGRPGQAVPLHLDEKPAVILVENDCAVVAFDLESGGARWRFELEHGELAGLTLAGPVLCLLAEDGFVYGLRPDTGAALWQVRVRGTVLLPPLAHQGRLYVTTDGDNGFAGLLHSIYPLTGRRVYQRQLPAPASRPPLAVGDVGLFPLETSDSARLLAIGLEDGESRWSLPLECGRMDTPALTALPSGRGCEVVVKTDTGQCLGISTRSGALAWSVDLTHPGDFLLTNVEPIVVDGQLIVAERHLSILDPVSGRRLHRLVDLPEHPSYLHAWGQLQVVLGEGEDHLECFDVSGFLALVGDRR